MLIGCFVLLVFGLVILPYKDRSIIHPVVIFNGIWLVVIGLYSMHLFGLRTAANPVYGLYFAGIISFGVGYCIANQFRKKYTIRFTWHGSYELRYYLFCIIGAVCVIYFFKDFVLTLIMLVNGEDYNTIRALAQGNGSILNAKSSIENLIYNFMVLPAATAIEVVAVTDFWFGSRRQLLFILNLIIIFMRVIADGGRTPLVDFLLYMVGGYLLYRAGIRGLSAVQLEHLKAPPRNMRHYGVVGLCLLAIMTLARTSSTVWRQLYFYFAMSPYLFDHWISVVNQNHIVAYGTASLNGFVFTLFYFIKNLFLGHYPLFIQNIYNLLASTDSTWITIAGPHTSANAYVSVFWFFYADGNLPVVIIGMFLYGFLVTYAYVSARKSLSPKNVAVYLLLFQGLAFSFIRFPFSKIYYALAFILILFFTYKPARACTEQKMTNEVEKND